MTLSRAWYAAGKFQAAVPVVGSFEDWTRTMGGVLHHAGVSGFLASLKEMYESSDQSGPQWEQFLRVLAEVFGDRCFRTSEVMEHIVGCEALREAVPDDLADDVEKPGRFKRRLGTALSKRVDKRHGDSGVHVEKVRTEKRAIVRRVSSG